MIRPSVIVRCSAMECGPASHPAACSLGTTNFLQVSASFAINSCVDRSSLMLNHGSNRVDRCGSRQPGPCMSLLGGGCGDRTRHCYCGARLVNPVQRVNTLELSKSYHEAVSHGIRSSAMD